MLIGCTVVVKRVIAFSHGEAYARIASLATDSTLYTRCRTHRGRTWRGRAGWTLVYSLFLFLQPNPLPRRPEVSLTTCLFVSFSAFLYLFSTRTGLAFLPADAGELAQRCQATLSPARSQRKTRVHRPIELHFNGGGDGGSLPLLTSRQRCFLFRS